MDQEILLADGLENAFIGLTRSFGLEDRACYSINKIIEILTERDGMSKDEAYEFFEFNILGAYVSENMPIFLEECKIQDLTEDE